MSRFLKGVCTSTLRLLAPVRYERVSWSLCVPVRYKCVSWSLCAGERSLTFHAGGGGSHHGGSRMPRLVVVHPSRDEDDDEHSAGRKQRGSFNSLLLLEAHELSMHEDPLDQDGDPTSPTDSDGDSHRHHHHHGGRDHGSEGGQRFRGGLVGSVGTLDAIHYGRRQH